MSLSARLVTDLARGTAHSFAEWPNSSVPYFGAGIYTIWHKDTRLIYVWARDNCRNKTPKYTKACTRVSKATPADAVVAISSAFTWPTVLSCQPYLRTTSLLLRQAGISWMLSYDDTSARTFSIGLQCCPMGRPPMLSKQRSRSGPGTMAAPSSTPGADSGTFLRAPQRLHPETDANVAYLSASDDQGASCTRWQG
jgi:hypothetical protein